MIGVTPSAHLISSLMYFNTEETSTAVDGVILPILTRNVQVAWQSGSVAVYEVRRRDQLRCIAMNIFTEDLSWGRFCNWAKDCHEYQYC